MPNIKLKGFNRYKGYGELRKRISAIPEKERTLERVMEAVYEWRDKEKLRFHICVDCTSNTMKPISPLRIPPRRLAEIRKELEELNEFFKKTDKWVNAPSSNGNRILRSCA